ncbi:hypothetical protein EVAR_85292_1 [Eumeta japonica]|uniref:Uncharacterized protein n=1 Tax=Eumeta variegata TaxID=151549 RepID=A0A4C1V8E2_EUMVA|nr:hypothetical protein EVAR_85292_1 [Eumeta japonica]
MSSFLYPTAVKYLSNIFKPTTPAQCGSMEYQQLSLAEATSKTEAVQVLTRGERAPHETKIVSLQRPQDVMTSLWNFVTPTPHPVVISMGDPYELSVDHGRINVSGMVTGNGNTYIMR